MTIYSKKYCRLLLSVLIISSLLLGSSCGAPQNVWSIKMESIYSKEVLELKLRAQVYRQAPNSGFFIFKPMVSTTLEDLKVIAEEDKRVKAEIIRDGLLITKENTPTQFDYYYLTEYTDQNIGKQFVLTNLSTDYYLFSYGQEQNTAINLLLPIYIFIADKSEEYYLNTFTQRIGENIDYQIYSEYDIDYLYQFYQKSGFIKVSRVNNTIHLTNISGYNGTQDIITKHILSMSVIDDIGKKYLKITTIS